MKNRTYGILLIVLSLISIYVLVFLLPCGHSSCTEPECKDITGALIPLIFGVPMVIDSLIHKNIKVVRKYGAVHFSKTAVSKTIRNLSHRATAISPKKSQNRNCS